MSANYIIWTEGLLETTTSHALHLKLLFSSVMSGLGLGFTGSYIFSQTIFTFRYVG